MHMSDKDKSICFVLKKYVLLNEKKPGKINTVKVGTLLIIVEYTCTQH